VSPYKQSLPLRVSFISLGCAKNLVDSEKMLGLLAQYGFLLVDTGEAADVTIINTCGFISDARREAFENIEEMIEAKHQGVIGKIIVVGCLAQFWQQKLTQRFPDIDAVVGLSERDKIGDIVRQVANLSWQPGQAPQPLIRGGDFREIPGDQARLRLTEPCWSYLRISEGCDRNCTFCTIPKIRGPFRSKRPEDIIREARELIRDGVVELNLIGQETSSYGSDIGFQAGLAGILRELNALDGLRWIRVLYAHPATLAEAQVIAMAQCQKVVPYIDIPLQHINDRILKRMNRQINRRQTEQLLKKIRQTIDNLAIRTTMLVGFPSETEQEFEELLDFVREYRFDALGAFMYSAEELTAAERIENQIAESVKKERLDRLMILQQQIAFELADTSVGQTYDCLITGELHEHEAESLELNPEKKWYVGRHPGQAPEMDSLCYLTPHKKKAIEPGVIVPTRIVESRDYDLIGIPHG